MICLENITKGTLNYQYTCGLSIIEHRNDCKLNTFFGTDEPVYHDVVTQSC